MIDPLASWAGLDMFEHLRRKSFCFRVAASRVRQTSAGTNKTTAVWPRLQAVLILTAWSGFVFVFQLPTSHAFWPKLIRIDHDKSHTKHLYIFQLYYIIPISVQQFGPLCHTPLMRLCLSKRCRDNNHQWADPFYPTVLWAVHVRPHILTARRKLQLWQAISSLL